MPDDTVHTFCRICEPGCGLVAERAGGEVLSLRPDPDHPVHKGFSCHKGVHYLQVHTDPDRLDTPLKRLNPRSEARGEFAPIGWDQAVSEIAAKLKDTVARHGPQAVTYYQGNPTAFNSTYYSAVGRLRRGLGVGAYFGSGTQDMMAKFAASEAVYGAATAHPIPDLVHTDYFLCLGSNPQVSHMSLIHISDPMAKLRAIRSRGGTVLFVNPRRIESSAPDTGDVLLIKPDTDFYFLAGVLNEIVFHIGFDRDRVERHARHVDEVVEYVRSWPVERVAPVTGLDPDDIRRVARDFCSAPSASVMMSTGVNQGRQGTFAYWMLTMVSLFSGNLGRRGGNIYARSFADTVAATKRQQEDPFFEGPFGEIRLAGGELPATLLPEYITEADEPVRAMIVVSGNPVLTVGGEDRLRRAFEDLELLVCLDLYRNSTGELADYVLPATDWLEHADINFVSTLGVAMEPYVQYTPAVVAPRGERRDDWWILSRIIQGMGGATILDDATPDPFAVMDGMLAEAGLSIETLQTLPCQTAVLPEPDPDHVFSIAVQHDDGLIDCLPRLFTRRFAAAEAIFEELAAEPADQLKLITRRTATMVNSWMHNVARMKQGRSLANPLWMNPDDARGRGLTVGQDVLVSNEFGRVRAILDIDDTLRTGVVAMTHGWGHERTAGMRMAHRFAGVNANALAPMGHTAYDPLSNQSQMTGIRVEVRPA